MDMERVLLIIGWILGGVLVGAFIGMSGAYAYMVRFDPATVRDAGMGMLIVPFVGFWGALIGAVCGGLLGFRVAPRAPW